MKGGDSRLERERGGGGGGREREREGEGERGREREREGGRERERKRETEIERDGCAVMTTAPVVVFNFWGVLLNFAHFTYTRSLHVLFKFCTFR